MDLFIILLEALGALIALIFGVYGVFIDTTIEKNGEEISKGKRGLPRLTKHGKIALLGIFLGGMTSLIIKVVAGVKDYNESLAKNAAQKKLSDSLSREYRKDQAFKYQVDSSLRSTLKSLDGISKNTDSITTKQDAITNKQAENLSLQQVQIYNTQKILTPFKPLTLSLIFSAPRSKGFVKAYYERITKIKKEVESGKRSDGEGLDIPVDRASRAMYVKIKSPYNEYFPGDDDDYYLQQAVLRGREFIRLTEQWSNSVNTYKEEGFVINVSTSAKDSFNNVNYIIAVHYARRGEVSDQDSIEFHITCDINDHKLIETFPGAPSFSSIYDLRGKYISVSGLFAGSMELKQIVIQSGPDKKITNLYFNKKDKFSGGYFANPTYYYQRKILSSEIQ